MNFNNFEDTKEAVLRILKNYDSKAEWQQKRINYFSGKPDLNDQILRYLT
jgi:hypothetical protein